MLQKLPHRQKVIVMLAVMSGLFLAALDQTIIGTALPKIVADFQAFNELSWVATAYLLTSTIAVPISGKLSDIYGRRRLLLIGIVIFLVASLLCGIAGNIWQLIAFRALQGVGGGILFANAFSIIGDLFAPRDRAKWQGTFGAVFGLSSVIGPLLGGYLSDPHSLMGLDTNWRWTFLINIPVGLIAFGLIARYMPRIATQAKAIIDYLGAALLAIALSSLVLATSLGGSDGWAWGSPQIIGLLVLALAGVAAFVAVERRAKEPILPLRFFKNYNFNITSLLVFMFGAGFFGIIFYVPTYAQQVLNFSATNSGILVLPMIACLTLASTIVGQRVSKTGRYKKWIIAGMALAAAGSFSLSLLTPQATYFDLAWRMGLAGLGIGMSMPLFNLIVQNMFGQKDLGAATSSSQLFRSIGGTVGVAIMGGVVNSVLAQKLSGLQNDTFLATAQAAGISNTATSLDANALQQVLSPEAQAAAIGQLQQLPAASQQPAMDAFTQFISTAQTALGHSLTRVFLISATVMLAAMAISFWLKEEPLMQRQAAASE